MLRRGLACALLLLTGLSAPAGARLHTQVLVFVPAYEGSQLYDPTLLPKGETAPCVWGGIDAIRTAKLYFALRLPNPLDARPMLSAGPLDVYGKFVSALTEETDDAPRFAPYTEGTDFFIFPYDWRQEIATVTVPQLAAALEQDAKIHEAKTGVPAADTKFVIVTHSMGGLVVRTLLGSHPEWAPRVAALYLAGCPNLGSVKAIKTLVIGPGGLRENALNFPASLLNLLPNDVDAGVTKLVAITRPSLYELLPFDDPRWECVGADGSRRRIAAEDLLTVGPWAPYWPSAELERKLFLDGWLKDRQAEGRKAIAPAAWEFCQDAQFGALQKILAQVRDWRLRMGSLGYTAALLTAPGQPSRLKVVLGTGLKTPTGIITEGEHDTATARFTYGPDNDGDETVTGTSALDDLHGSPGNVKLLPGVTHGRLMSDPQFLNWFRNELADQPLLPERSQLTTADRHSPPETIP